MKIVIIIPAYNEALNLSELLPEVKNLTNEYDVVIINDASKDNTAYQVKKSGFNVINLPVNLGIGGAMQTGYLYAYYNLYDIAVQLDGDGQHDPEHIGKLLEPIFQGEADMVVGSRFIKSDGFQSSFIRRMGIKFFRLLIYVLTGKVFTDPTSGFRACNKAIISHFASYYPSDYPEPETLVSINRLGFTVVEVPVIMRKRVEGQSSINAYKALYYMVKVTLAILIDIMKKDRKETYTHDGTKASDFSDDC